MQNFQYLKKNMAYEVICDEQEFTLMPEIQDDIEELKKRK